MREVDFLFGFEVPGDGKVDYILFGVLAFLGLGEGGLP
jgi:hypothetical protein